MDRCVTAGCGDVWQGRLGMARAVRRGWRGELRQAGHGKFGSDMVRNGQAGEVRSGTFCSGEVRQAGLARWAMARSG